MGFFHQEYDRGVSSWCVCFFQMIPDNEIQEKLSIDFAFDPDTEIPAEPEEEEEEEEDEDEEEEGGEEGWRLIH